VANGETRSLVVEGQVVDVTTTKLYNPRFPPKTPAVDLGIVGKQTINKVSKLKGFTKILPKAATKPEPSTMRMKVDEHGTVPYVRTPLQTATKPKQGEILQSEQTVMFCNDAPKQNIIAELRSAIKQPTYQPTSSRSSKPVAFFCQESKPAYTQ
jgi:hypothetical protein